MTREPFDAKALASPPSPLSQRLTPVLSWALHPAQLVWYSATGLLVNGNQLISLLHSFQEPRRSPAVAE